MAWSRLEADVVHVWCARPAAMRPPERAEACARILAADERARLERFRFPRDRRAFLTAHALARTVLSRYAPVPPAAWAFASTRHGRPEIVRPRDAPPLRFNLSHTDGLVACAVALRHDVGVDVEHVGRTGGWDAVAERWFAAAESASLRALPPALRQTRFFDHWTLKEAYVKARGLGLSLPIGRVAFAAGARSGDVAVHFDAALHDDPRRWRFALFRPTGQHVLAVAVGHCHAADVTMVLRHTTPLDALPRGHGHQA